MTSIVTFAKNFASYQLSQMGIMKFNLLEHLIEYLRQVGSINYLQTELSNKKDTFCASKKRKENKNNSGTEMQRAASNLRSAE